MKLFFLILLFGCLLEAKTIKHENQDYQCTPVKSCEEQLKIARAEIKALKKQLKEKITVIITEIKEVEKLVNRKNIISILAVKDVISVDSYTLNNVAEAKVETGYIPAVTYQYKFDSGFTPLLGVSIGNNLNPIVGLGWEF